MASLREFVANDLVSRITNDARRFRIFNEADLQFRAAYHLEQRYVSRSPGSYLLNQPFIRIGKARGAANARPDIVIADVDSGPFSAFELKCYLDDADTKISRMITAVWEDIDQLRKFKQRFPNSEYAFAIVLADITKIAEYVNFEKELKRTREPWMVHFLRVHVINLYCDENGRKRPNYDQWAEEWLGRQPYCHIRKRAPTFA